MRVLSVPVLGLIPAMSSGREAQVATLRARLTDAAGGAILIAAALVLVIWRLQS